MGARAEHIKRSCCPKSGPGAQVQFISVRCCGRSGTVFCSFHSLFFWTRLGFSLEGHFRWQAHASSLAGSRFPGGAPVEGVAKRDVRIHGARRPDGKFGPAIWPKFWAPFWVRFLTPKMGTQKENEMTDPKKGAAKWTPNWGHENQNFAHVGWRHHEISPASGTDRVAVVALLVRTCGDTG